MTPQPDTGQQLPENASVAEIKAWIVCGGTSRLRRIAAQEARLRDQEEEKTRLEDAWMADAKRLGGLLRDQEEQIAGLRERLAYAAEMAHVNAPGQHGAKGSDWRECAIEPCGSVVRFLAALSVSAAHRPTGEADNEDSRPPVKSDGEGRSEREGLASSPGESGALVGARAVEMSDSAESATPPPRSAPASAEGQENQRNVSYEDQIEQALSVPVESMTRASLESQVLYLRDRLAVLDAGSPGDEG
jgi:hypothetical protein